MLEERLAAVWDRLRRIADTGDPSLALEPQALTEARRLTELLHTNTGELRELTAWNALGWLHFHRYTALPDSHRGADLDTAVEAFTPSFLADLGSLPAPLLPHLASAAETHARNLLQQATESADPELLSSAVDLWQRIAQATPAEHPDRAAYLNGLGNALMARFGQIEEWSDLDQAVAIRREAVHATPADHPNRAGYLHNLGLALGARFGETGSPADLDQAIDHLQAAVRATRADHPDRAGRLFHLGNVLRARFGETGSPADLDQAIDRLQTAVRGTPADHPDRASYLNNVGATLRIRFEWTGDRSDLDQSVDCLQVAVQATPTGHPNQVMYLHNLGLALGARFGETGTLADLDQAITVRQQALNVTPADDPNRAMYLNHLGATLRERFEWTGDRSDLDQSVDCLQVAVQVTLTGDPDRALYLSNLGFALRVRFRRTGDVADLEQAVAAGQEAVNATPADHPGRVGHLFNLGGTLQVRFGRTGNLTDLDQAIAIGQQVVNATPADHPDRMGYLNNLGLALQDRFGRTGDLADLDQAIDHLQAAVRATPADHPDRAGFLNNLGNALRDRFEWTGDLADLEQAVAAGQEAVNAMPADHPDRSGHLTNLGAALHGRFGRTGDLADLDQAVAAGQEAVNAMPADHPDRVVMLSNLGIALRDRFGRTGDLADLDRAIDHLQAVVRAMSADHPDRARYLSNLGLALRGRFGRTGDLADLDRAIDHLQAAVRATPADHPDRAGCLNNLGLALHGRFGRTGDLADLDAAASAYTGACGVESAAPSIRIRAAWVLAGLVERSDAARAADAAEGAVRLLPEVTLRQLGRGDQQHVLGDFAGLAGDAAALALADPRATRKVRATRALRLLEAGRAVLLSQALDTRSDLSDLNRQHPDLAARFVRLRDQFDQPSTTTAPADDRNRLARDFAQTLAEIRDLDGFSSFALPPTTEELLTQAEQGPVVVFNVSRYRSDALLLTREGITHLELPQLTADTLTGRIASFQQALHTTTTSESKSQRRQGQDVMTGVLQWLWDTAAGPVLSALGHHRQPAADADWPRVWWAPGGLLGLLPLDAAGYHDDPADDPNRRTVMDRVISSHTPTVRALRYARQYTREHTPHPDTPSQGLIVAMPTTPGLPHHGRLNHVSAEAEVLRRHLPNTVLLREPDPDGPPATSPPSRPTKAAVLDHLPHCPIAHFACHGASHPTDPSQSLLLLHDHQSDPLTVASLTPVRLDHAQLAYLSACNTAAIDTANLADEAIHLTSAFQLAGFPHVVGTLWEIDDQIAVTVADTFYTHLRTPDGTIDTSRAARALHQAVRSVRDGHDLPGRLNRTRTPYLWAAYLHAGA
ncbi:tetratricopeptide repeat protein [Streptomyces niveus]|uniref:CHAT domain-containing tetratricopeptide repeat protein n=1 Tax=Streptomyces niveus TaxID=193462 RepID=UPI0036D9077E